MEAKMQVIIERCAGFDVHQETVVACVLIGAPGEWPRKQVRTFRTMTRDLEALRDWLQELGVTQVGMESTGVYWRPVYAVLEGHFDLIVGNARHIRNVPGRKTDVKDAEWIADLVRHGLIAKSFVPPAPQRELRELLRYRRKLVESQAAERNRLLKLLETANIKLASVASDVFGVSGRAMLKALIEAIASAEAMADLARGQLRRKRDDLVLALEGRMEEHHRFLLATQLRRLEAAEQDIAALDDRIEAKLESYRVQHGLLMQIPGVDWVVAAVLIAEIGVDMSVFLSVYHLAAWAGVCPGNHESAGKQKSARAQGQCPPAHHARRRCHFRRADQGHLPQGQVPPPQGAPRRDARGSRHRSQDPRGCLSHACQGLALPRTRRSLPRPDRPDPNRGQPQTTYRAPRLQRHPRTKGRARMTLHRR
jgi:transposase